VFYYIDKEGRKAIVAGNHRIAAKKAIQAEAAAAAAAKSEFPDFDPTLLAIKLHSSITDKEVFDLSECTRA